MNTQSVQVDMRFYSLEIQWIRFLSSDYISLFNEIAHNKPVDNNTNILIKDSTYKKEKYKYSWGDDQRYIYFNLILAVTVRTCIDFKKYSRKCLETETNSTGLPFTIVFLFRKFPHLETHKIQMMVWSFCSRKETVLKMC